MIVMLIVLAIVALWAVKLYNGLVRRRSVKDEGWSGISVQLKRRHDLIPNLVATAKGLAGHEKELMMGVTQARAAQGGGAAAIKEIAKAESALNQSLSRFMAIVESYPEVKSAAAFQQLMGDLSAIEEDLQMSRRYYNGTARDYNVAVQSFPGCLLAGMMGFKQVDYFELESAAEAAAPQVSF